MVSTGIRLRVELNFRSGTEDIGILELNVLKTVIFVAKISSDLKNILRSII
jgi:hypothetical protein